MAIKNSPNRYAPSPHSTLNKNIRNDLLLALLLMLFVSGCQLVPGAQRTTMGSALFQPLAPLPRPEPLRVGIRTDFAPYESIENGQPKGFNIDVIEALAAANGYQVEFVAGSVTSLREMLSDGELDVISSESYTPERDTRFDFTNPYLVYSPGLFIRGGSSIRQVEDLSGKRVAVVSGDAVADLLLREGLGSELVLLNHPGEAMLSLSSGEVDAVVLNADLQGMAIIEQLRLENVRLLRSRFSLLDQSMAVAETNDELLIRLNSGIDTLKSTGEYDRLRKKWFQQYESPFTREFIWVISGSALLLVFSAGWVLLLRRQVRRTVNRLAVSEEKYRRLLVNASEGVVVTDQINILYANPAAEKILGFSAEQLRELDFTDLIASEDRLWVWELYQRHLIGAQPQVEYEMRVINGQLDMHWLQVRSVMIDWEGQPASLSMFTDVTSSKNSEQMLRESEERFRLLYEEAPLAYQSLDEKGRFLQVNSAWLALFGYTREEVLGAWFGDLLTAESRLLFQEKFCQFKTAGEIHGPEFWANKKNGQKVLVAVEGKIGHDEYGLFGRTHCILIDITERRRAEDALRTSEEKFSRAFRTSPDSININRVHDGLYLEINEGFTQLTGYTSEDVLGKTSIEIDIWADPADRVEVVKILRSKGEVSGYEALFRLKNGEVRTGLMSARVIEVNGEKCIISITRDISERKMAEQLIRKQLDRLAGLRAVDIAITSSRDLALTLHLFLDQVRNQLKVDACCMLLHNLRENQLEYFSGQGLNDLELQKLVIPLGQKYPGLAAQEMRPIHISQLDENAANFLIDPRLAHDCFTFYYAVPFIAKGEVQGVLELYQREFFEPDAEWLEFLDALADQGAIAIENMNLFEELEQANQDLLIAYDATIRGWAHTLELRDRETEGHSQRVVEMTLQLARRMGMPEASLVHIRRGALLHDIGKMGIPDQILFKTGELNEEEWQVMRKHPTHAYNLLSGIPFLQPAVEIPYCHHEHWDGSGYPRGLKGEEIPLAARIFAVVDVWDALLSGRAYRCAWDRTQVLDYVISRRGFEFDPQIVDIFIEMLNEANVDKENIY